MRIRILASSWLRSTGAVLAMALLSGACSDAPASSATLTQALTGVTQKWTVTSAQPVIHLMPRNDGSALATTREDVLSISASGGKTVVFDGSTSHGRPFLLEGTEGFGVPWGDRLEVYDATGARKTAIPLAGNEYGRLIPGSLRTFVPRIASPDPENPRAVEGRIFSEAGQVEAQFSAPELVQSRTTRTHVLWATRSTLTKTTLSGVKVWSAEIAVHELETDAAARFSIVNRAGDTRVVELYEEQRRMGGFTFDAPIWNMAMAPQGQYAAANSKTVARLFRNGAAIATVQLGTTIFPVSLDVSDLGYVAVGTQDRQRKTTAVSLYDATGALKWSKTLPEDSNAYRPEVRFTPDGKGLFVRDSTGLSFFVLEAP